MQFPKAELVTRPLRRFQKNPHFKTAVREQLRSSTCRSSESRGELPSRNSSGRNLSRGKRLTVEFYEGARPRARAVCQARLHAYSRGWRGRWIGRRVGCRMEKRTRQKYVNAAPRPIEIYRPIPLPCRMEIHT